VKAVSKKNEAKSLPSVASFFTSRRLGLAPIRGADPHVAPGWLTAAVAAVAATMGRRDDEALLDSRAMRGARALSVDIESPFDRPVIRKKGTTGPEKDQIGASLEERAHHATLLAWD